MPIINLTVFSTASNCSRKCCCFNLLLGVFAEDLVADFLGGFATVFELEDAGVAEFLEVLEEFLGHVEFEAGAFEFEAFPTDALFAEADDQADDFAVKAGGDLVFVTTSMARLMSMAMTASSTVSASAPLMTISRAASACSRRLRRASEVLRAW
jgi:hypothetical protein